jgi:hypothetical protein
VRDCSSALIGQMENALPLDLSHRPLREHPAASVLSDPLAIIERMFARPRYYSRFLLRNLLRSLAQSASLGYAMSFQSTGPWGGARQC